MHMQIIEGSDFLACAYWFIWSLLNSAVLTLTSTKAVYTARAFSREAQCKLPRTFFYRNIFSWLV